MVLPFWLLRLGGQLLMNSTFFRLQAGLADAIDTHFYVLNPTREVLLQGLGVHIKTLGFQAFHMTAAFTVKMRMRRVIIVRCHTVKK